MKNHIYTLIVASLLYTNVNAQVQIDRPIDLNSLTPGNARIMGIKEVSDAKDAVSAEVLQKGGLIYKESAGGPNAYTLAISPAVTPVEGTVFHFKANIGNAAGGVTLNGIPVKKDVGTDLAAGDIQTGQLVTVAHDGTRFQLISRTTPTNQVNADWNAVSGAAQILNKPTIPAAQVNSDWNSSSGVSQILNKPTIPAAQIQSDWNQTNNTAADYIKNKPAVLTSEVDGVIGNEVTDATGSGGLTRTGSGNTGSPYTLGIATGGVTSTHIADGTIVNGDINATAGIAVSKLAAGSTGNLLRTNGSAVEWFAPSYLTSFTETDPKWSGAANQTVDIGRTGSVSIGAASPSASAILDISSTAKGVLFPRMTTVQRDAIASPVAGLMIYNTNCKSFDFYNGTTWVKLHDPDSKSQVFDYTGGNQNFVVPCGVTTITVKMWGGGGGGSTNSKVGGGGGYSTATVAVTPNETLVVKVGSGGTKGILRNSQGSGPAGQYGSGYGGTGGTADNGTQNNGAAGGGGSGLWRSSTLLMAAGGGGGAANHGNGGAGGGAIGETGGQTSCANCGGAGANDATNGNAGSGTSCLGTVGFTNANGGNGGTGANGAGCCCSNAHGGGGGGGGYGGGGGAAVAGQSAGAAGGGGSGYVGGSGVSGTRTAGSGQTPGNSGDSDRGTAGLGGAASTDGNPGRVVIFWQ